MHRVPVGMTRRRQHHGQAKRGATGQGPVAPLYVVPCRLRHVAGETTAGLRGHRAARFGTATAGLSAPAHHLIVARQALATLRASLAGLGAETADPTVEFRTPEHEVGARGAGLGAIEQRPDVGGIGMLATHVQAMRRRLDADGVAVGAIGDAVSHLGA